MMLFVPPATRRARFSLAARVALVGAGMGWLIGSAVWSLLR